MDGRLATLREAAMDSSPITGLTHTFYRYPARFPPSLAATAIRLFSQEGDVVLDPFVGGGTTVVEAYALRRAGVGCDISPLATFIGEAKTTLLSPEELDCVTHWRDTVVPTLKYHQPLATDEAACPTRTRNLATPFTKHLKKIIALSLAHLPDVCVPRVRAFVRCAVLNTAQWALDGRLTFPTATAFRLRLQDTISGMLEGLAELRRSTCGSCAPPIFITDTSQNLLNHAPFRHGTTADLIVASPPYPGVHVLYHRWQIRGRRETPAPFWIAALKDGRGSSHYTMGCRRQPNHAYFTRLLDTMAAVRQATRSGAFLVQVIGFQRPSTQLDPYLATMKAAGFREVTASDGNRISRVVPRRRWHATLKGLTPASTETVLVHRAE